MTEKTESPRQIADILDLMEIVSLAEIRNFEISAKVTGPPADEPGDPELVMEYSEHISTEEIHCRFRFTVATTDAEFRSDIASVFALEAPSVIARPVLNDFAERVGFMAAFPYIRESISTSAARLGRRAPLIGLMRPGDLKIEQPDGVQDGESA